MSKIFFIKKKIGEIKEEGKKKWFYYLFLFLLVFLLVFSVFNLIKTNREIDSLLGEEENISLEDESCETCFYRLIDNKEVATEKEISPFILAAVIDNHPDARPAFGLSRAEIVYDVPAEGGINRYLAIFAIDEDKSGIEIGPVRSARPYFLDIAKEYEALLLHCGGSPEALARISKEKLPSLNEFYNGAYYRRYPGYLAPHNVLAIFDNIKNYSVDRNLEKSIFDSWKFKNENNFSLTDSSFEINISNGQRQYDILWEYDINSNSYSKSLAGKKHLDNNGDEIYASNLILQLVDTKVLDSELRLKIETVGSGKSVICIDGSCLSGYWERNTLNSRTTYYYDNDEEVVFNTGKTWIHLIDPKNTQIDY